MRLGIDFGTTRTRVSVVLNGNYPCVAFQTEDGDFLDWYPSLIAVRGDEAVFGLRAQAVQYDSDWQVCLLHLCRQAKESITPNARKITVDLGQISLMGREVLIPVPEFYEKCQPLIDRTIEASVNCARAAMGQEEHGFQSLACVYLAGGSGVLKSSPGHTACAC